MPSAPPNAGFDSTITVIGIGTRHEPLCCLPKYSCRLTATSATIIMPEWRSKSGRSPARTGSTFFHPISSVLLKKANHVLERCHPAVPLRTLDAIHTAACDLSQDFPLCTTDKRMRDAAGVLGIPVFPANESS